MSELFKLYRAALAELKARNIVRTANAPAGDYAEYLVAAALRGVLAPNSEKSWDMRLPDGKTVQAKARVVADPPLPSQRELSVFRSFDFDWAVIVLLAVADFSVWRAVKVPMEVVKSKGKFRKHVNGTIVFATDDLLNHDEALDITNDLRDIGAAST